MNRISRYFKTIKDNRELKKSNWGRDYGWFIEHNGENIGELVDGTFSDMFWFEYKIIPYQGYEEFLVDHNNWFDCDFKFKNKHYLQYAETAFCGGPIEQKRNFIMMRALSISSIEK